MNRILKLFASLLSGDSSELTDWSLVTVENENERIAIKLRTLKPTALDIDQFNTIGVFRWSYTGRHPSERETERLNLFEEGITEVFDINMDHSHQIAVVTGSTFKEYICLTRDKDHFMNISNAFLQEIPMFPVELESVNAPDWKYWKQYLKIYGQSK